MARKKGAKDKKIRKKKVVKINPQKQDNFEKAAEVRRTVSSANRVSQELRGWINLGRRFM